MARKIEILAVWDEEAQVFVITSHDVPGLVTEAGTAAEIDAKLQVLIPELLELNGNAPGYNEQYDVLIRTERSLVLHA